MKRHFYPSFSHGVPDRRKRRAQQKVKKTAQMVFLFVSIPVLFACIVFLLFFSKFFAIDRIDVLASGGIDSQDVRSILFKKMDEHRFLFAQNGNMFLFDTKSALDALNTSFAVDTLSLKRQFPSTLQVVISGRSFAAVWCTQGACYTLYTDGKISQQIDAIAMGIDMSKLPASFHSTSTPISQRKKKNDVHPIEIPVFVDERNDPLPQDQSSLVASSALTAVRDMVRLLTEKGIKVAYIRTHNASADTTAVTEEGWDILFTPFEDIPPQIENLQTVLDTKIKKDRKKLKYIDVRFQNHIYYTFR